MIFMNIAYTETLNSWPSHSSFIYGSIKFDCLGFFPPITLVRL